MSQTTPKPWGETTVVGKAIPRIDAYERVSGSAHYPLDVVLPDMLYAAILRCPHGHAMVKKVDTARAHEMPGVRAVLSDADPEAKIAWYGGGPEPIGQPALRSPLPLRRRRSGRRGRRNPAAGVGRRARHSRRVREASGGHRYGGGAQARCAGRSGR